MKLGTKTLLFGTHCPLVHTWFVAAAWRRLYGGRELWNWRLWLCFLVHDLGYWGCADLDGREGRLHPIRGAALVHRLTRDREWSAFCLYHSRHFARLSGAQPSRLCAADKLAVALCPTWLYLLLARASGELGHYLEQGAAELEERLARWSAPEEILEAELGVLAWAHISQEPATRKNPARRRACERIWFQCLRAFLVRWAEREVGGG